MKTRSKEIGTTHGGASHIHIGIISIHVISVIQGRGSGGDGRSTGVEVMVQSGGTDVRVMATRGGGSGDNGWMLSDSARRRNWNGDSIGSASSVSGLCRVRGMGCGRRRGRWGHGGCGRMAGRAMGLMQPASKPAGDWPG